MGYFLCQAAHAKAIPRPERTIQKGSGEYVAFTGTVVLVEGMVSFISVDTGVSDGEVVTAPEGTVPVVVMVCTGADSGFVNVTVAEASSRPILFSGVLSAYISCI
jgi:hypothetical protein